MTKVFYNDTWLEYDYETFHNTYGMTLTRSTLLTGIKPDLSSYNGWKNSGKIWVVQDSLWYPDNSSYPYYIYLGPYHKYRIDQDINFDRYYKGNIYEYVVWDNQILTTDDLYHNYGFTDTPSIVWRESGGVPWSWYNDNVGRYKYWDDRVGKKYWTDIPPEEENTQGFSGSFVDDSTQLLTLDLAGNRIFKNHLLRRLSITPFNGELVVGGNIKTTPIPSEEGDYGYMDDLHDFHMYYIETGNVGKPTVFYSSILTEKTGEWGTIPMSYETRGYLRSATYQGSNKAVTANSTNYLYPQGESGGMPAEAGKTYTLTGAYTNADASVSIDGCSLTIVSNQVRLIWGPTAAQVCYVTIEVS